MYTGCPLDGSVEHVLPESLGSTLKSAQLISSAVNGISSRSLDPALFKPLESLCHQLGIRGKKGPRQLRLPTDDGQVVELAPDQRPTLLDKPKPTFTQTEAGTLISVEATDYRQLQKILRSATGGAEVTQVAFSVGRERMGPVPVRSSLGGYLWLNAVRKVGLNLVGYFDAILARSRHLQQARSDAFTAMMLPAGDDPTDNQPCLFDGQDAALELSMRALGPVDNTLAVSCDPRSCTIVVFLRLLGGIDSAVVLSSTYDGPAQTFVYHRNPLGRTPQDTICAKLETACASLSGVRVPSPNDQMVALLTGRLRVLRYQATENARRQAIRGLMATPIAPWLAETAFTSRTAFADAAREFVIDALHILGLWDAAEEAQLDNLATALAEPLSVTFSNYAGKTDDPSLLRQLGGEWWRTMCAELAITYDTEGSL